MTPKEAMVKALEMAMIEEELFYALNVARQVYETFGLTEKLEKLMQRILRDAESRGNTVAFMQAACLYGQMCQSETAIA